MLSQNGYTAFQTARFDGPYPRLRRLIIPDTDRMFVVRDGSVGFLLGHSALWWHENIYPLNKGVFDDWSWAFRTIKGSSTTSNHASGTAIDINATRAPLGVPILRVFRPSEITEIRRRMRFYQGTLRWGGEWDRPDGMHVEASAGLSECEKRARDLMKSPRGKRILEVNPGLAQVILS